MEENYISGWKIFSWKKKYLAENFFIRWENIWCETNLAGGDFWRKVREYKSLAHPLPAKAQTFNWWWWWWLVMVIIILCWQFIPLQELAAMAQTLIFHSSAFLLICRLSNYFFFISKKITSYGKIPSFIGSWYKVLLSPETTSHTDLVLTLERKPGWQGRQICIKSKYKYKVIWFWHIYIKYKYKDLKVTSFLPHMHKRNHSFATREREPDERTSGSFTDSYEENMEVPIPYHRYKIPCQYHRYQSIPYHRYGLKNLCQNSMYTTLLCNAHTIGRIFFWSTKCLL